MSRWKIWILAIRPKTLPAAVSPVIVGTALAYHDHKFRLFIATAALVGSLLLQILSNLANDYYDFIKGVDDHTRVGPVRVTQSGLLTPIQVRNGAIVVTLLAIVDGLYLIFSNGGLVVLLIGLFSIIFAIIYSGGPYPLSSLGLGDIFVFIFFGLIAVPGTYYVQALTVTTEVFIASIPAGLLITAILVVNNYRDFDNDLKANKRTFAHFLGKRGTRYYYSFLVFVPFTVSFLFIGLYPNSFNFWLLLPLISLPLAFQLVKQIHTTTELQRFNVLLGKTAMFGLLFNLLFSLGLILS